MTSLEATNRPSRPIDAVAERLDDPAVAASLVTLLDNAELLWYCVLGLSGMIERSECFMDSFVEGIHDLQRAGGPRPEGAPTLSELTKIAGELAAAAPALQTILDSSMTKPETIELLSMMSEAATEGAATAAAEGTAVKGAFGAMRALRDPDVQRGIGMFIEISRALGRRLDARNG